MFIIFVPTLRDKTRNDKTDFTNINNKGQVPNQKLVNISKVREIYNFASLLNKEKIVNLAKW